MKLPPISKRYFLSVNPNKIVKTVNLPNTTATKVENWIARPVMPHARPVVTLVH